MERGTTWASAVSDECEEVEEEPEARALPLDQVSPGLRAALEQAAPGVTGMRSVRAVGPAGNRYAAGLYDGHVLLLELPWPNPDGVCRKLRTEPPGLVWVPHRS